MGLLIAAPAHAQNRLQDLQEQLDNMQVQQYTRDRETNDRLDEIELNQQMDRYRQEEDEQMRRIRCTYPGC